MKLKPLIACMALVPAIALASSHREAPFVAAHPTVDASDFYMFMSYEPGREGYVTLLANYVPLQDPAGGPNFYSLNPDAVYDIHIDNNGDAKPDITYRFKFTNTYLGLAVPSGGDKTTAVPLLNIGPISADDQSALNRTETYTVSMLEGNPRDASIDPFGFTRGTNSAWQPLTNHDGGSSTFTKPVSNIGNKSIPDYESYAQKYMYDVDIPGCSKTGRVFVGQRKDGFVVNLAEIFDLVNLNPAGPRDGAQNTLHNKNVTTLAMEVPKSCLVHNNGSDPVIGGWTTASLPKVRVLNNLANILEPRMSTKYTLGVYTQESRLGAPLVNEVVIGLPDKNKFNNSLPSRDTQFLRYVTNPSLSVLLNVLFGDAAKVPHTPRNDLVAAFLTGVPGLNQPKNVVPSEQLRLNTSIPATAADDQNDLGVLGGDKAGFPNGRRPYDDVVDIELRVMEGALCGLASCGDQHSDPNNGLAYTDGARAAGVDAASADATGDIYASDTYLDRFPYLMPPIPGSPNGKNGLPADGSAGAGK
ncbi:MAG: DUF4331 domain-containing protein [Xanthomonadales bacterium]|nr:DUF4331 domain-containing protein [Xanthomonadales bacterium]